MRSHVLPVRVAPGSWRRFLATLAQWQIAMCVGALVCYLLGRSVPATSGLAAIYYPGAYLFTVGDVLFLASPVVAWMLLRGHGWRHSLEMAAAMTLPVAVIILLGEITGYAYRPWLITAGYPAMALGMLAWMLYRPHALERLM